MLEYDAPLWFDPAFAQKIVFANFTRTPKDMGLSPEVFVPHVSLTRTGLLVF